MGIRAPLLIRKGNGLPHQSAGWFAMTCQKSDAQSGALGLDALDHLVAQLLNVGFHDELGLDPVLDAMLALKQRSDFLGLLYR